jgi:hypothetical protein
VRSRSTIRPAAGNDSTKNRFQPDAVDEVVARIDKR